MDRAARQLVREPSVHVELVARPRDMELRLGHRLGARERECIAERRLGAGGAADAGACAEQSDRLAVENRRTGRALRAASSTHLEGVSRLFVGQFSAEELMTLGTLLARLPGGEPEPDEPECAA